MTELKLTKSEITKMMREYDFVKFVKDLDHRAEEFKRSEKAKEILNGKTSVSTPSPN